jgi:hypothetical protein
MVNAAINSPNVPGEVHACVADAGGAVRIIGASAECADDERFVTWNKSGRRGPQGLQGIQGIQGLTGAAGKDGIDGTTATNESNEVTLSTTKVLWKWDVPPVAGIVNGEFQDVGTLVVSLPAAGTYLINANLRGFIDGSDLVSEFLNCFIVARIKPGNAAAFDDSERLVAMARGTFSADSQIQGTAPLTRIVTVTQATTITVQASWNGTACPSAGIVSIANDTAASSNLSYVRLS